MSSSPASPREKLASRLGFLMLSAGCAIGLGNIWRFPYITGQYGGAIFVILYLFFLLILGFPVMVMELGIGRGGQSSLIGCYRKLQPQHSAIPWQKIGTLFFCGNVILLMFYSVITGWLLSYSFDYIATLCNHGPFNSAQPQDIGPLFDSFLANWPRQILFMFIALVITYLICILGLQSGVERITKFMMAGLFLLMIGLGIQACLLDGSGKGLSFFLKPNLDNIQNNGFWTTIHAAMSQAFFTLSLGIGSLAICGSYIDKSRTLAKEASIIIFLDTFVAICAGIIIFPCCFTFDINPEAGPSLIFVTLPRVFLEMSHGTINGAVFFIFLSIAALTTLVAVAENIIAFGIDELKLSRPKSTTLVCICLFFLALPCIFGFNLWSNFHPFGADSVVLDLEDFIVSDNLLPLGALAIALFCTTRYGWGRDKFYEEVNTGLGFKFPKCLAFYCTYILPVIIFAIWIIGIAKKFNLFA